MEHGLAVVNHRTLVLRAEVSFLGYKLEVSQIAVYVWWRVFGPLPNDIRNVLKRPSAMNCELERNGGDAVIRRWCIPDELDHGCPVAVVAPGIVVGDVRGRRPAHEEEASRILLGFDFDFPAER